MLDVDRDKVANADAKIVAAVALVLCVVTFGIGTFVQNLMHRNPMFVVLFPLLGRAV
jgi:hypothetical protein